MREIKNINQKSQDMASPYPSNHHIYIYISLSKQLNNIMINSFKLFLKANPADRK